MIKSQIHCALKCLTCIRPIGAVGHYQAAETGLLRHLSTAWSSEVIPIQCMHAHCGDVYRPQASQTLPPTPFLDSEIAILRRLWSKNRRSLQSARVSAARTIHKWAASVLACESANHIHINTWPWSLSSRRQPANGNFKLCTQAPITLPPTPSWTAKSQFYADFGTRVDIG